MIADEPEERLTFARPGGGRFQISPAPLRLMRSYIQNSPWKTEAGGVLLGRHIADSPDIVVDEATVPMRGDRRERCRFSRAHETHQRVIDHAWRESGGTCAYLGEWHTHPEPVPTPSVVDRTTWRRKLREDRFSSVTFFVILGTRVVRVWEGHQGSTTLLPLNNA